MIEEEQPMRCPDCSTVIPHAAKFCPKCGERAPKDAPIVAPMADGAVPSRGPLPRAGKLFFFALLAGLALMVGAGFAHSLALFLSGVALIALVVVISVIGDLVT
jgi:hypothetical protein